MGKPRLTICILARDEEAQIGRALSSAKSVCDELLLVDTGSTDRTVEIATSQGAQVINYQWNDSFADARNAGLEHATGEWVLMLDADEVITPGLSKLLPKALRDQSVDAYMTVLTNLQDGRPANHGAVLRLFRNRPEYRYTGRLHESIVESIRRSNGRIKTLRGAIEHYGYNPTEDKRKGRRERNKRLLETMLREDPNSASTWYFLGVEEMQLQNQGQAVRCFLKALELDPNDIRSIYGAHLVAGVQLLQMRIADTWKLPLLGAQHEVTRWDSLVRTAEVALLEGDYLTATGAVNRLRGADANDFGMIERNPGKLAGMEALAAWQQGRREEALRKWERGVKTYREDADLANQWVHHRVLAEGLRTGALGALQSVKTSPVAAAVAGALLRAGEFQLAATLSRNTLEQGMFSPYTLYGMIRAGLVREAETEALKHEYGAIYLATAGVWFNAPDTLARAREALTGSWREAFEAVLAGKPVTEEEQWALDIMMTMWADVGCLPLLDKGARSLSADTGAGIARAAWLLYHCHQPAAALERALQVADHPDAQETLGLIAAENGDWEAAAQFLVQRAFAGVASVRVYQVASHAFLHMGRRAEAQEILQLGLTHRPDSKLLKQGVPK
ncbi:MAG: glycosyltransferase [Bacillota bacterium]